MWVNIICALVALAACIGWGLTYLKLQKLVGNIEEFNQLYKFREAVQGLGHGVLEVRRINPDNLFEFSPKA